MRNRNKIIRQSQLKFPNKFANSGVRQTANTYYKGTIDFLNPSSALNDDSDDLEGLFTGNALLPQGVTSLKTAEKNRDMIQRLQRYNAGIFDEETRDKKALLKIMKKQKTDDVRKKLIKWIANNDKIDEIPPEFEEEVQEYYKTDEGKKVKKEVDQKREKRKKEEEEKAKKKKQEYEHWKEDPWANIGLYTGNNVSTKVPSAESMAATARKMLEIGQRTQNQAYIDEARELSSRLLKQQLDDAAHADEARELSSRLLKQQLKDAARFPRVPPIQSSEQPLSPVDYYDSHYDGIYDPNNGGIYDHYNDEYGLIGGLGEIGKRKLINPDPNLVPFNDVQPYRRKPRGFIRFAPPPQEYLKNHGGRRIDGWAAPRLHNLVRPFKPFVLEQEPEQIVDEQKKTLDEWRDGYKEQKKDERGILPPKDMIERAFPKTAEPVLVPETKKPRFDIIPHPFILSNAKYQAMK
jgi:hypothetical protein